MIMVLRNVLKKLTTDWYDKLLEMIPSYGKKLAEHPN
jgi:malate dehydrogenase (quinone)